MNDIPYFSRRNRDLGTISVYIEGIVTSAVYHPTICIYELLIYCPLINTDYRPRG